MISNTGLGTNKKKIPLTRATPFESRPANSVLAAVRSKAQQSSSMNRKLQSSLRQRSQTPLMLPPAALGARSAAQSQLE